MAYDQSRPIVRANRSALLPPCGARHPAGHVCAKTVGHSPHQKHWDGAYRWQDRSDTPQLDEVTT